MKRLNLKVSKGKFVLTLFAVALMMTFYSCNKSVPAHLNAIPADATFVVAVEPKQIIKKAGLGDMEKLNIYKYWRKEMKEYDSDYTKFVLDMFDEFAKNPQSMGVGLDKAFVFGMKHKDDFFVGVTFEVNDEAKLEAIFKKMIKEEFISEEIENEDGYKIIRTPSYRNEKVDASIIAWNRKCLIIGSRMREYYTTEKNLDYGDFFKQSKENSIVSNTDFSEFYNRTFDAGLWLATYDELFDVMEISKDERREFNSMVGDLSETHLHTYLNFDAGELKLSYIMSPKSKVKKYFEEYPIAKEFNKNLFK
jgi:hypothetical protein